MSTPTFAIALHEPQIPQNTGAIARTCAATDTPLHLIGKMGFTIDEKRVRRAGLDYWPNVKLSLHSDWSSFTDAVQPSRVWALSTHARRLYSDAEFADGDVFLFGSETRGLGEHFLKSFPEEQRLRIPIVTEHVRSLNLSNAAAIVLYEALRQRKFGAA